MTKGRTILAGVLVLVLFGALVGVMSLPTIFAQESGQGNLSEGSHVGVNVVNIRGGAGIPEVIRQAVEQGIISQEQADQLLAGFEDMVVGFGEGTSSATVGGTFNVMVEGDGVASGRIIIFQRSGNEGPAGLPDDLQLQLQGAVTAGQLTQAEADQIWADLQSGELNFLAITEQGVYTDPNALPEEIDLPPLPEGAVGTAILSSDVNIMGGPAFAIDEIPSMVSGLQEFLSGAVSDGIINQDQADQIAALGEQLGGPAIFFSGPAGTTHLPNFLLLEELTKALQEAVSNGKVSQETADSLLQQLTEAIGD